MTKVPTTTTTDVLTGVDLSAKLVLVTGGTTGLGFETVRALCASGADVVLTARSEEKGRDAVERISKLVPGARVSYEILELDSLQSIRQFTDRFIALHHRLDVLIANAGIMAVPFGQTNDGFELQFGTNHLGHFCLVGRLLPLLTASAPARIVVLSSGGHGAGDVIWDDPHFEHRDYSKMDAYAQAKTANILHVVELERRYGPLGVHAWAVHPGMVATDLGRHFTREDYKDLVARAKAGGGELPARVGVDVGASTQVWAAVSDGALDVPGNYLANCGVAEAKPYATNVEAAKRLWEISEQMIGESFPEP